MDDRTDAVRRMQEYLEQHLGEKTDFALAAKEAGYSPWHARRLFLRHIGITPAEYVRKIRLRNSALRLRDGRIRVIDAALECGYDSTDGFQRAFQAEFGCNPKEYEMTPVPIPLYTPYKVFPAKTERKEKEMETKTVFLQIVERPRRKLILKRGIKAANYWDYCSEAGCDVWGMLTSIPSVFGEPVCLWLPEKYVPQGTSVYVQGVEVAEDYAGPVPDGYDEILLPAAKYLMFQGEPFAEEDYEEAISAIWDAEKKYDPSVIGCRWDNENPRIQLEPIGTRGYIELMPVVSL